jgi:hypothetical protein
LAWEPGMVRSCRTAQPWRSSGASSRAVRRSPAAPRRQATVSGELRKRSSQPSPAAASTTAMGVKWGTSSAASSPATAPVLGLGRGAGAADAGPGPAPPPPAPTHRT